MKSKTPFNFRNRRQYHHDHSQQINFLWSQLEELKGVTNNLKEQSTRYASELSEIQGSHKSRDHEIRDLKKNLNDFSERIRKLEKELHETETKLSNSITVASRETLQALDTRSAEHRQDIASLETTVSQAKGGLQVLVIGATLVNMGIGALVGLGGLVTTLFLHFTK